VLNKTKLDLDFANSANADLDNNVEMDEQTFVNFSDLLDQVQETDRFNGEISSVSIFDLMNDSSVQPLLQEISDLIGQGFRRDPEYPILARIKTCLLFYFVGNGNLSLFYRTLVGNSQQWGPKLGYAQNADGLFWIPSYKTLHQFFREYLGKTINEHYSKFVKIVMNIAQLYGIRPGWRSIFDSTPYESTPKDKEATYSGHYEVKGYKEHRMICADTDIPLAFHVTPNTDYDGHYAKLLLEQALDGNAAIAEIWMDQHYSTYENLPYFELVKGLKTHYRINKKWKLNENIHGSEINRIYQKQYKSEGFLLADDECCTVEFKLQFIWENSKNRSHRLAVGKFLRNQAHQKHIDSPKQYLAEQGLRSLIESGFGREKSHSMLKLVQFRGLKSWTALIGGRNFLDLLISLFSIDLGKRRNLTSWKGITL